MFVFLINAIMAQEKFFMSQILSGHVISEDPIEVKRYLKRNRGNSGNY